MIREVAYEADGREMVGTFAVDELQPGLRPAVLVCHEGPGLDEHAKGRAIRLAGLGYAAFALDYHGGGGSLPIDEAMGRLGELIVDPERTRALGLAGLDVLLAQEKVDRDRIAVIGYCFGGAMAVELARSGADVKAAVGFHPGIPVADPDATRTITASVLLCCGADDPIASLEQRGAFETELREAGVADWRIEVYGGVGHSFTNPSVDVLGMPGFSFDAVADRRAWRSLLDLLAQQLDGAD